MSTPHETKDWRLVDVHKLTDPRNPDSMDLYQGARDYRIDGGPWQASVERDGNHGILIDGLGAGIHHVQARITSAPGGDLPIVNCGSFVLS